MSDELPRRIELIFQDAVNNIRFFKGQQWTVTNYAFAAYAALVALAQLTGAPQCLYSISVALVAGYHAFIIHLFMKSISKFRGRIRWIYDNFYTVHEGAALGLKKPKRDKMFGWSLIGASVVGAILAIVAIDRL